MSKLTLAIVLVGVLVAILMSGSTEAKSIENKSKEKGSSEEGSAEKKPEKSSKKPKKGEKNKDRLGEFVTIKT